MAALEAAKLWLDTVGVPAARAAWGHAEDVLPAVVMRQEPWALAALACAVLYVAAAALGGLRRMLFTLAAMSPVPKAGRISSKILRTYSLEGEKFYAADGAPPVVAAQRKAGLDRLSKRVFEMFPKSIEAIKGGLLEGLSDLRFTDSSRVPFPFQRHLRSKLPIANIVVKSDGPRLTDIDGNVALDVSGSYGVNVIGVDRFKKFMAEGLERTKDVGTVLGPLHPIIGEVLEPLKKISGLDEVSFHMSGTEAVMCGVRLCCFNKRRGLVVVFNGAYHGWWDGVQPGPGNERAVTDVLTLNDMSPKSLAVIKARASEIACVLVNPLQGFNPNLPPPNDLVMLDSSVRKSRGDTGTADPYRAWLHKLRETCTTADVPLLFDEVYSGFRMAVGGGQEFYGVQADMVIYGKVLGGGYPVGVCCGRKELMQRFDPNYPVRVAYVIGTFSAHPAVLGSMAAFLKWVQTPATRKLYDVANTGFSQWIKGTNDALEAEGFPVRVNNLTTVWTLMYTQPGRYHWMLQYYMRSEGVALSWVGTGRLLVSLDFKPADLEELRAKLLRACRRMQEDGWWWCGTEKKPLTAKAISARIGLEIVQALALKTIRDSILNDVLALPVNEGERAVEAKPPASLSEFYHEIMRRKADDHAASHSNCVNQFMHFCSSSIFIYCYAVFFNNKPAAMAWGLFSLALRQSGHAIFEPPCHDDEELLLGFNTRSKCFVFSAYILAPLFFIHQVYTENMGAYELLNPVADAWLLVTLFFVLGHTAILWLQYGFRISMVWLIKLMTDPITDIQSYYPSCYKVWTSPDWKAGGFSTFMSHWNKEGKDGKTH